MAYKFDLDFQEHILASYINDEKFLRENFETIRPEFFGDEILGGICEAARDFWKKHRAVPDRPALIGEIKNYLAPGRKITEYKESLDKLYSFDTKNFGYYQGRACDFAKVQAVASALRNSVPLLEAGEFDSIEDLIRRSLQTGSNGLECYDYFLEAGGRIKGYLNGHGKGARLGTGLTILDDCMNGGLAPGELGVVVALPKHGKTTTLVNFGARALLQNKRVVYFTLELSKKMIASKFDTSIFGRSLDSIRSEPKAFAQDIKEMRDRITGKLFIAEYPTSSMTLGQAESVISKIGDVDLVIVDYGQLLKAPTRREQSRFELTETYQGLRRLAGEMKVPIWTAHQANRPGTNARILQPEHIAEDFNVVAISDISISVNHSEEEYRKGLARLYVMCSRIGPSGSQVNCNVNWKLARITQSN